MARAYWARLGGGVLTLPNANTYTGGTVVSNGTLQVNNSTALGTTFVGATTGTVTNNGVMNLNIGRNNWFFYPLSGNGTINVTETANAESRFDGNMSGFTGTITVPASSGSSKVDIEGNAVWNSAATIIVSNGGTLFVESASTTNDWAGQAEQVAATIYVSGSGNSEGYGALRVDDAAVITGNVILQGTTVYGGAYDHHGRSGISGVISDGGLGYGITCANTISGQAEEFWGANTYSGGTTWTNAVYTLVLGNGSALQNSTLKFGPGQLWFDSVVTSNAFLFGGLSGTANVTLTNGTGAIALTVGNNNSSTVYNGGLSDAGMGAFTDQDRHRISDARWGEQLQRAYDRRRRHAGDEHGPDQRHNRNRGQRRRDADVGGCRHAPACAGQLHAGQQRWPGDQWLCRPDQHDRCAGQCRFGHAERADHRQHHWRQLHGWTNLSADQFHRHQWSGRFRPGNPAARPGCQPRHQRRKHHCPVCDGLCAVV